MSIIELKCPNCRAPISPDKIQCEYCSIYYLIEDKSAMKLGTKMAEDVLFKRKATDEALTLAFKSIAMNGIEQSIAQGHSPSLSNVEKVGERYFRAMIMARDQLAKRNNGELPTVNQALKLTQILIDHFGLSFFNVP